MLPGDCCTHLGATALPVSPNRFSYGLCDRCAKSVAEVVNGDADPDIRVLLIKVSCHHQSPEDRLTPSHACKVGKRDSYHASRRLVTGKGGDGTGWRLPPEALERDLARRTNFLLPKLFNPFGCLKIKCWRGSKGKSARAIERASIERLVGDHALYLLQQPDVKWGIGIRDVANGTQKECTP